MRELRAKDARVSYVNLSRNFGKEIAMIAGIDYLQDDAAVIMDADLQDPPELIPEMIGWWEKGYDDISAKRRSRAGESFFKKWSSHAFYRILQHLTNIPISRMSGTSVCSTSSVSVPLLLLRRCHVHQEAAAS